MGCLLSSTELDPLPLMFTPSEVQAAASWAQQSSNARHARPAMGTPRMSPMPHGLGDAPWVPLNMVGPLLCWWEGRTLATEGHAWVQCWLAFAACTCICHVSLHGCLRREIIEDRCWVTAANLVISLPAQGMPPPSALPTTHNDNSCSSSLMAHLAPPMFPPPLPPFLGANHPAAGMRNAASMLALGAGTPFLGGGMGGLGLGGFPASPTGMAPGLAAFPPFFPWAPQDVSTQLLPTLQLPPSVPNGACRPVITTGAE